MKGDSLALLPASDAANPPRLRRRRRSGGLRLVHRLDAIENLAEALLGDLNVTIVLQIEPKLTRCAELHRQADRLQNDRLAGEPVDPPRAPTAGSFYRLRSTIRSTGCCA